MGLGFNIFECTLRPLPKSIKPKPKARLKPKFACLWVAFHMPEVSRPPAPTGAVPGPLQTRNSCIIALFKAKVCELVVTPQARELIWARKLSLEAMRKSVCKTTLRTATPHKRKAMPLRNLSKIPSISYIFQELNPQHLTPPNRLCRGQKNMESQNTPKLDHIENRKN